jgi:hypothetical protein
MIVKDIGFDDEIPPDDDILPAYERAPSPTELRRFCWSGPAYLVTAGSNVGIFKTW